MVMITVVILVTVMIVIIVVAFARTPLQRVSVIEVRGHRLLSDDDGVRVRRISGRYVTDRHLAFVDIKITTYTFVLGLIAGRIVGAGE